MPKPRTSRRPRPSRFDLYELAVQAPELQARFLRALHGGLPTPPTILREDFSGPAAVARAWLALDPRHRAIAVDRDPEPLQHARARLSASMPEALERAEFIEGDVRACQARADMVVAFNFAVCELHDRAALLDYLQGVRASLNPGGFFACDLYAGADAFTPCVTRATIPTPLGPLRYTWEQRHADPINACVVNAMHFRLGAGATIRDAFVYHWRLWSIPELSDALAEAGFASTEAHLSYGGALDINANPIPRAHQPGDELDANFVAYIIARV